MSNIVQASTVDSNLPDPNFPQRQILVSGRQSARTSDDTDFIISFVIGSSITAVSESRILRNLNCNSIQ